MAREPVRAKEAENVFRCEGEYWTLAFDGSVCRLRDTKGLHHLAQLLQHPGQPFEARELVAEPEGGRVATRFAPAELGSEGLAVADLGDAGAVLDAKAKAEYRRRLDDLREELAEAERFNDPGRTAVAREEIEFITSQLTAAVGLGGRDRKAASSGERARLTVTKRIKDTLGKIRDANPALGQHLAVHVKTGYLCVYMPAPGLIPWEF
jgi:non-specific serine/threonine protein kinase